MTKEVPGRKEGRKEGKMCSGRLRRACRAMPGHARPGNAAPNSMKWTMQRSGAHAARPSRWQDPGNWNGHGTQPLEEKKLMGATFFNVPRLIKQCRLLYGNTYITAPYHRDIIQYEYRESSSICIHKPPIMADTVGTYSIYSR